MSEHLGGRHGDRTLCASVVYRERTPVGESAACRLDELEGLESSVSKAGLWHFDRKERNECSNKKMLEIEGGPNKLFKTKGKETDILQYPNKLMKTNRLT